MNKLTLICNTNSYDDYQVTLDEKINLDENIDYNVHVSSCSYGSKYKQMQSISFTFDGDDKPTTIRFLDDHEPKKLVNNINISIYVILGAKRKTHVLPTFDYINGYLYCGLVNHTNDINGNFIGKRFTFSTSNNSFLSDIGFDLFGLNEFIVTATLDDKYYTHAPYELDPSAFILSADIAAKPLCVLPSSKDYIQFDGTYNVPVTKKSFDSIVFKVTNTTFTRLRNFRRMDLAITLIITRQYKPVQSIQHTDSQLLEVLKTISTNITAPKADYQLLQNLQNIARNILETKPKTNFELLDTLQSINRTLIQNSSKTLDVPVKTEQLASEPLNKKLEPPRETKPSTTSPYNPAEDD